MGSRRTENDEAHTYVCCGPTQATQGALASAWRVHDYPNTQEITTLAVLNTGAESPFLEGQSVADWRIHFMDVSSEVLDSRLQEYRRTMQAGPRPPGGRCQGLEEENHLCEVSEIRH